MELQRQKRMEFKLEDGSFQGMASGLLADCSEALTELGTICVLLEGYISPFLSKKPARSLPLPNKTTHVPTWHLIRTPTKG